MVPGVDEAWINRTISSGDGLRRWLAAVAAVAPCVDDAQACRGPFRGELAARRIGDFGLLRFRASGHALARRNDLEPPRTDGHFLASLQLRGEALLYQDGRSIEIGDGAGAVGLVDTSRPFQLEFPTEVHRIFVFVPRKLLVPRAPWLIKSGPISLGPQNPIVSILAGFMTAMAKPNPSIDDESAHYLLTHFVDILALASSGELEHRGLGNPDRLRRERLLFRLRDLLCNPDLSPEKFARHVGVSVRTMHKLFEGTGNTFSAWVRNERLEVCAKALAMHSPTERVSTIAYYAGFNDLSSFHRSFKAKFGMTPRDWRRNRTREALRND
jgi:AraC family transcriptional regulator, positive regulator of tynA and feaB